MMKLRKFKVMNFRSVKDSGWISCDDVTSLVGINESGKSNIIMALWKLNPVREGEVDLLHDLPAKEYTNWRNKESEIRFITAEFELDESLVQNVVDICGCNPEIAHTVKISRKYDERYLISFPEYKMNTKVAKEGKESEEAEERNIDPAGNIEVRKLMINEMPSFVYYSNYGNLDAQIYLPHAVAWLNGEKLDGLIPDQNKVRTLRVLFDYVGLNPKEVLELGSDPTTQTKVVGGKKVLTKPTKEEIEKARDQKEERTIMLNSAGSKLTKEFKEWWRQGNYIFRFQADGDFFKIWVSDEKRPEEIELERRSTGLQWFLSFYLVFLVESREAHKGAILLLDEAGLSLHPLAQKDLISFFEGLSQSNQIIYTTHSPFMVDTSNIDCARVIYSDKEGYTVASNNLRASSKSSGQKLDERSVYALHAALGLSVSDVLLQGCQPVIVEGPSDQNYLNAIKLFLIRNKLFAPNKELVFMPSGGVKGVQGIVSIVCGTNDSLPYVLLDSDSSGEYAKKRLISGLYKDEKDKVIILSNICKREFAEIEDLIPVRFFERPLNKLFQAVEESFMDAYDETKPIVNQIENFAADHAVGLDKKKWKTEISKSIKNQLQKTECNKIDQSYVDMWKELFERLNIDTKA
ncbi:MAG: ATP-binding protein [Clostridiales bacterium]|nr:ATP-binding protein [Clostridiales bacterium]